MRQVDLTDTIQALNGHGFIWVGDVLGYFKPDWGKLISIQWIETHSVAELLSVASKRPTEGFEFVFNEPPSENVKRQLREKLGEAMNTEQLLRVVRRIVGCLEGESVVEKVLQLYEEAQNARRSSSGGEGDSLRRLEGESTQPAL